MTNLFSMLIGFLNMTIVMQAANRNDVMTVVLGVLSFVSFFGYMFTVHKSHQKRIRDIFRGRLN